MAELVDKQAALAEIDDTIAGSLQRPEDVYIDKGLMMARTVINKMPTVKTEVRHGRWIKSDVYTFKKCSECGSVWDAALCENIFFIYCPRCGSKNGGVIGDADDN
jgi:rRNA maturation protein Nop10